MTPGRMYVSSAQRVGHPLLGKTVSVQWANEDPPTRRTIFRVDYIGEVWKLTPATPEGVAEEDSFWVPMTEFKKIEVVG